MPAEKTRGKKSLSLEEFKSIGQPEAIIDYLGKISSEGSLMACHSYVYKETGLWFPELVGTFTKLDALVAQRRG